MSYNINTYFSPGRLEGRIALVTGGARGQGAAHARRLAEEGATVYATDVLDEDGHRHCEQLRAEGLDVHYRHHDVGDESQWKSIAGHVADTHGKLDILVNNAGIIDVTPLQELDLATWNRILGVNLTGAFLGMKTMSALLRKSGKASVINTASIFGPSGAVGYAAYAASKSGLIGLTRTAALEMAGDSVRVNALVPGGVSTPLNQHEKDGGVIPETPLGRRAHVTELSAAVAFLASDDASFVTGTELEVDGGFRAR